MITLIGRIICVKTLVLFGFSPFRSEIALASICSMPGKHPRRWPIRDQTPIQFVKIDGVSNSRRQSALALGRRPWRRPDAWPALNQLEVKRQGTDYDGRGFHDGPWKTGMIKGGPARNHLLSGLCRTAMANSNNCSLFKWAVTAVCLCTASWPRPAVPWFGCL